QRGRAADAAAGDVVAEAGVAGDRQGLGARTAVYRGVKEHLPDGRGEGGTRGQDHPAAIDLAEPGVGGDEPGVDASKPHIVDFQAWQRVAQAVDVKDSRPGRARYADIADVAETAGRGLRPAREAVGGGGAGQGDRVARPGVEGQGIPGPGHRRGG